jgi:16S rRNA G966 N2-methylase RsmD
MNRIHLKGTLYIPYLSIETSVIQQIETRLKSIKTDFQSLNNHSNSNIISTGCSSAVAIKNESIDYIFLDPPCGSNIMYAELKLL